MGSKPGTIGNTLGEHIGNLMGTHWELEGNKGKMKRVFDSKSRVFLFQRILNVGFLKSKHDGIICSKHRVFFIPSKRVSYFKNFEHKAFLIPSKGFFSSKILSIEFFNSKHGILLFLVLPRAEHGMNVLFQAKGFLRISRILSIGCALKIGCEGTTRIIIL